MMSLPNILPLVDSILRRQDAETSDGSAGREIIQQLLGSHGVVDLFNKNTLLIDSLDICGHLDGSLNLLRVLPLSLSPLSLPLRPSP